MKQLLVIRVTPDVHDISISEIYCHAHHYNIQPSHIDVSSLDELKVALIGKKLDYLYFAGHGDETCFTDNNIFSTTWNVIGKTICEANCLNPNSIIMLYCCKGGINTVAYQLIAECNQISYICGAKQNMKNIDLIIGFNVFLYSIENRNISPVISAQKATLATDIEFECFDRVDVESNPRYYYNFCKDCPKPLTC
jgi:hypothetical protein